MSQHNAGRIGFFYPRMVDGNDKFVVTEKVHIVSGNKSGIVYCRNTITLRATLAQLRIVDQARRFIVITKGIPEDIDLKCGGRSICLFCTRSDAGRQQRRRQRVGQKTV